MNRIDIKDCDIIFLSYDEPNAEKNYADLKRNVPWAKRVHGVDGIDSAHKACAEQSDTEHFLTVDGDTQLHTKILDLELDLDDMGLDRSYIFSWCGHISLNGLKYGNGSLKLWNRKFVKEMRTHENYLGKDENEIEFCHFPKYYQFNENYSTSYIDGSAYQAWRAGFREGVKMSLDRNVRRPLKQLWWQNYQRLLIWMSVGMDNPMGIYAIHGARTGCYLTACTDWDFTQANQYSYFEKYWRHTVHQKQGKVDYHGEIVDLGAKITKHCDIELPVEPLTAEQSKFFKQVYLNTPRILKKRRTA